MKSLMAFVGILAFNLPNITVASDFSCPVTSNVSNFTCSGTVKVKTLAELNAYANNLGVVAKKPTIAKNLQIDFNPALTSDLVISTPCSIKVLTNIVMTSTANICLHGAKGISIDEDFKFTGKNLKLESKEEVIINKNAVIKAQDIKLLSIGSGDSSKTYIREAANIEAANLSIESFDKGFIGKKSIVKLTGALGIYSLGDDEASVREGARVEAAKIEISSTEETRIAKSTTLVATEIILNGVKCTINKTAVITATDRLGNCFLTSTTNKAKFSINKNQGTNPLTVNFNASTIADAKGFIWSFGDGEILNSLTPNVTHIYNRVGSFTATLKYATKDNYKGLKSAGAIQIDVKEAPISNPVVPVPPRGNLKYQSDGTFIYLRGYIRKGTYDIANAYYVIDDNQNNKIQIPNFYQNSLTGVEMHTFQRHKVTMHVIDVQGLTHSKSMNINPNVNESDARPYMRLDVDQTAARTIFFDLSWSFNPNVGETLKNFKMDFGDGQTAVLTDTAFITHTYAQAGTYLVRASAEINGNEEYDEYEIEVTDENSPIMNPVAGFEYQIYDYAGNVMFTNDRSGTPNGEIISYIWDFGDGTIGYGKDASNFYAPGDYLVTLTVVDTAGMRSSQTQKITIVAEGDDIASMLDCWSDRDKHLGCEVVAFDKFNEITRVKLDWGDGTSENLTVPDLASTGFSIRQHDYQSYGTYNVELIIDTSRGISKRRQYEISYEQPSVKYPPIANIQCQMNNLLASCNALGSYDPQNSALEYTFDYKDGFIESNFTGISTHAFSSAGQYNIHVTVKNIYGQESISYYSVVAMAPVENRAPFADLYCYSDSPNLLKCYSGSSDADGYISTFHYDWGDEQQETVASGFQLSHVYSNNESRVVKITVTDNQGATASTSATFEVMLNNPPAVAFECTSPSPMKITCLSNSIEIDNNDYITEYKWDMGNGEIVSTFIPYIAYEYNSSSTYTVKLAVKDSHGLEGTIQKDIIIKENQIPVANFDCTSRNDKSTYDCSSTVSDSDGQIVSLEWLIEGEVMTGTYITYKFKNGGNKDIELHVVDDLGAMKTVSKTILVNLPSFVCNKLEGVEYECMVTSIPLGKIATNYRFEFDDDDFENNNSVKYKFKNFGTHQVSLLVGYEDQTIDTSQISINVGDELLAPEADFGPYYNANKSVQLNAKKSTSLNKRVINYIWNFGDGNVEASITPYIEHTYVNNGAYTVGLTVVNQLGQSSTKTKVIYVHNPEVADPGEEGNETILGTDSDSDGVRDDVQRWINFESRGNESIKLILRKLAINWQKNIRDVDDRAKSQELIVERSKIKVCLEGTVNDDDRSKHLLKFMEYIHFYTKDRFFVREKNQENFGGVSVTIKAITNDEKLAECQGL